MRSYHSPLLNMPLTKSGPFLQGGWPPQPARCERPFLCWCKLLKQTRCHFISRHALHHRAARTLSNELCWSCQWSRAPSLWVVSYTCGDRDGLPPCCGPRIWHRDESRMGRAMGVPSATRLASIRAYELDSTHNPVEVNPNWSFAQHPSRPHPSQRVQLQFYGCNCAEMLLRDDFASRPTSCTSARLWFVPTFSRSLLWSFLYFCSCQSRISALEILASWKFPVILGCETSLD